MCIYKSDDGKSYFELCDENSVDPFGAKSYELSFHIKSFEFYVGIKNIWFYADDLQNFSENLIRLTYDELRSATLAAFSDFEMKISREDNLGHYIATFKLEDSFQGNSACLKTHLVTQSVVDFSKEILSILNKE